VKNQYNRFSAKRQSPRKTLAPPKKKKFLGQIFHGGIQRHGSWEKKNLLEKSHAWLLKTTGGPEVPPLVWVSKKSTTKPHRENGGWSRFTKRRRDQGPG